MMKPQKILTISTCFDCPHSLNDNSTLGTESICLKTLDKDFLPMRIDCIFLIPDWCELEDYKEPEIKKEIIL